MPSAVAVNALVLDAMPNSVWASTGVGIAQLADAVALRQHDLAVLHDRDRDAGDLERANRAGDPLVDVGRRRRGRLQRGREQEGKDHGVMLH